MINRLPVERAFAEYVSHYNPTDPKIKLKIDHTYRVASLCEQIGHAAGINEDLIWLCGMLHDIGRFEQVRRYNTFFDSISVDHAEFGADLLFKEGLISQFSISLTEAEQHILEQAIRNHSIYRLPKDLDEVEYCNVLRDADKIDIFRVNCDTPLEKIYNVTTEELKRTAVSEAVKDCFRNRTAVLRSLRSTAVDFVVGHICLVFELVYPISREIVREQGFLDKLLAFQSENPDTIAWFEYMKRNIWT